MRPIDIPLQHHGAGVLARFAAAVRGGASGTWLLRTRSGCFRATGRLYSTPFAITWPWTPRTFRRPTPRLRLRPERRIRGRSFRQHRGPSGPRHRQLRGLQLRRRSARDGPQQHRLRLGLPDCRLGHCFTGAVATFTGNRAFQPRGGECLWGRPARPATPGTPTGPRPRPGRSTAGRGQVGRLTSKCQSLSIRPLLTVESPPT